MHLYMVWLCNYLCRNKSKYNHPRKIAIAADVFAFMSSLISPSSYDLATINTQEIFIAQKILHTQICQYKSHSESQASTECRKPRRKYCVLSLQPSALMTSYNPNTHQFTDSIAYFTFCRYKLLHSRTKLKVATERMMIAISFMKMSWCFFPELWIRRSRKNAIRTMPSVE